MWLRCRPRSLRRRPETLRCPPGWGPALPPAPGPSAMQARALLLAALAALALAREPLAASCPTRCDVSRCPSPRCPGGYVPDLCNCCLVCAAVEGEPCGRPVDSPCGESLECARGVCRCRWAHAVCGTDGHTYANVCALQAASRRALQLSGTPVRQLQKGACPSGLHQLTSPRYKFNFIADVVEKIAPAVVHIELFLRHPLFGRNVPLSSGSGFIMSEAGLIVTNAHVVSSSNTVSGREQLKVQLQNGDTYEATIKDIDKKSDIATIKIHPKVKKAPSAAAGSLGRPAARRVRRGHRQPLRPAEHRDHGHRQHGPAGRPGAGPPGLRHGLYPDRRHHQLRELRGTAGEPGWRGHWHQHTQGCGRHLLCHPLGPHHALPLGVPGQAGQRLEEALHRHTDADHHTKWNCLFSLVEELKASNPDFPAVSSGIYVQEVVPNSPSQRGGIQDGDIIVKVNGRPLADSSELQEAVLTESPLLLEVRRGNDDLLFSIAPEVVL
nr:serine protease HTRA3 isoform X3 [Vicugna pacos]